MLDRFDFVRLTLRNSDKREGYLVDIDGQTGTLAGRNSNTAFHLPSTTIEVLHAGSKPVFLPAPVTPSEKPYRVAALVGTHTALEDYFFEEDIAKRYALAQVDAWTNNTPDRQFHQFTSILVLAGAGQDPH